MVQVIEIVFMNRFRIFLIFVAMTFSIGTFAADIYVNPQGGSDRNSGSSSSPFKTINYALKKADSGDVIYLYGGIYRESFIIDKDGITMKPYKNEYVLISGCELVDRKPKIYKLTDSGYQCYRFKVSGKVYQVFVNGQRMDMARFPNKTEPMVSMKDYMKTWGTQDGNIILQEFFPKNYKDYNDGYYMGVHTLDKYYQRKGFATWSSFSVGIKGFENDSTLILDPRNATSFYKHKDFGSEHGYGYIFGSRAALDVPNEWYSDEEYLYVIPPAGMDMDTAAVEIRTRLDVVTVSADNTRLENINVKAGGVRVDGDHNEIHKCSFRYTNPYIHNVAKEEEIGMQTSLGQWGSEDSCSRGIYVGGNFNTFEDCYIAHSWFSGMWLKGDNNVVRNTHIEDVCWVGRRNAGINSQGDGNIISHCSIWETGGPGIEGGNARWIDGYATNNVWEYNHTKNVTQLVTDQGHYYVNHQRGDNPPSNTVIRYNVLENNYGPARDRWSDTNSGIYLDNNSSGFVVHHNIIIRAKRGFQYNDFGDNERAGKMIAFYNNTFWDCVQNFAPNVKPTTKYYDVELLSANNLSIGSAKGFNFKSHGVHKGENNYQNLEESDVKDICNFDFTPVGKVSELKGVPLKIYNPQLDPEADAIDYVGAVDPRKGQFEFGADIEIPDFSKDKELSGLR